MTNILPDEYKKELRYEAWRRFLVSFGVYIVVVGLVADLLLLPSYFFLSLQIDAKKDRLNAIKKSPEYKDFEQSDKKISNINFLLRSISSLEKDNAPISPTIESILGEANSGISIQGINYSRKSEGKSSIQIQGTALTRQNSLDFRDALQRNKYVKKVEAPITNYIPERLGPFTLTLELQS